MPGNLRSRNMNVEQDHVPEEYSSIATASLKTRLSVADNAPFLFSPVVLITTSHGDLLLLSENRLIKSVKIPLKDGKKILVSLNVHRKGAQELVIVVSPTCGALVVDLQSQTVCKAWPDAIKVELKDLKLVGYPQIIVTSKGRQSPLICDSDWDEAPNDTHPEAENKMLGGVVQALETQLKNSQLHLLEVEKALWLRQCLVNRSLTTLRESVLHLNPKLQAPTFSTTLTVPNRTLAQSVLASDRNGETSHHCSVERSDVWQLMVEKHWIIGTTLKNVSQKTLYEVECMLATSEKHLNYRVHYYRYDAEMAAFGSGVNGFAKLLSTDATFDGQLPPCHGLTVIITTSIPGYVDTDAARANVFLTYSLADDPRSSLLQLDSVCLPFGDVFGRNGGFDLSLNGDVELLRRQVFGLASVLEKVENAIILSNVSPAADCFKEASLTMAMKYLASLECYHGRGFYGHVCVFLQSETTHRSRITIRAHCEQSMQWFVRHLQSALPDGTVFSLLPNESQDEQDYPLRQLSSAISLLSSVEVETSDHEEPMVVEADRSTETPVDLVRKEFLRKQSEVLALTVGATTGSLTVPIERYREFQKNCFDFK